MKYMFWCCTNYFNSKCTSVEDAVALQLVCWVLGRVTVLSAGWGYCAVFLGKTKGNFLHSQEHLFFEQSRVTCTEGIKLITKSNHEHEFFPRCKQKYHVTVTMVTSHTVK